jgi:hypothetical protein
VIGLLLGALVGIALGAFASTSFYEYRALGCNEFPAWRSAVNEGWEPTSQERCPYTLRRPRLRIG